MSAPLIIASVVFLAVFAALMSLYVYLEERYWRAVVARRLFGTTREAKDMVARFNAPWIRAAHRLGGAAMPQEQRSLDTVRQQLSFGGYRTPGSLQVYYGMRIGGMLVFGGLYIFVALLTGNLHLSNILLLFLPLAVGYYLPAWLLHLQVQSRQKQIFRELPDALDLVLICLEAGLGFDMALYRVSKEVAKVSPVLSEEFAQYFLEVQSGLPRRSVLRNLSERNGVESLTSVVAVLLQSIRFGTNIGDALKVHIQSMRTRRRQIAEESGAKISTKLTFPMVMLILPALVMVILGPALINIFEKLKGGL
ncbi:MAG: type II secretion protein F [Desulfobulbus propionicus]|nr:MAG: type II secretion protein F [Desulfobulbus propionicus]